MSKRSLWSDYIDHQLSQFQGVRIDSQALDETQREANESIRIRIKDNQIVRVQKSKDDMEIIRIRGYLALVQDVLSFTKIPDVDFIITLPDFAISYYRQTELSIPVFSFCRSPHDKVLLVPFNRFGKDEIALHLRNITPYTLWHGAENWESVLRQTPEVNARFPWEEKDPRCFFVGHAHDWNGGRVRFAEMSLDNPEYLHGLITWLPVGHEHLAQSRLKDIIGKTLPMVEFPRYKFLMHLDGNTSSERLRNLLALNSVVLKQESPYEEFYFRFLKPYTHFVPVKTDLSDLLTTLEHLRNDDKLCRHIADEGMSFVQNELNYQSVLTYFAELLTEYARLQVR